MCGFSGGACSRTRSNRHILALFQDHAMMHLYSRRDTPSVVVQSLLDGKPHTIAQQAFLARIWMCMGQKVPWHSLITRMTCASQPVGVSIQRSSRTMNLDSFISRRQQTDHLRHYCLNSHQQLSSIFFVQLAWPLNMVRRKALDCRSLDPCEAVSNGHDVYAEDNGRLPQ